MLRPEAVTGASVGGHVDAADVVAELYRRDASTRTFGIELVDAGPGRAVVSMVVRPDMCNGYDVCHGGMTFTLADTAMAFASGSHNQTALAAAASIDFLSRPRGSTLWRGGGALAEGGPALRRAGRADEARSSPCSTAAPCAPAERSWCPNTAATATTMISTTVTMTMKTSTREVAHEPLGERRRVPGVHR